MDIRKAPLGGNERPDVRPSNERPELTDNSHRAGENEPRSRAEHNTSRPRGEDERRGQENNRHRNDSASTQNAPRRGEDVNASARSDKSPQGESSSVKSSLKGKAETAPSSPAPSQERQSTKQPTDLMAELAALSAGANAQISTAKPAAQHGDGPVAAVVKNPSTKGSNTPRGESDGQKNLASGADLSTISGKSGSATSGKSSHNLGQPNEAQQAQNQPSAMEKSAPEASTRQQQAQDIARALANDSRVKIHVNVKDDSAASASSSSTVPGAQGASDNARSSNGNKANSHGNPRSKGQQMVQSSPAQPQAGAQTGPAQAAFDTLIKSVSADTASSSAAAGSSSVALAQGGTGQEGQAQPIAAPSGPANLAQQNVGVRKAAPPPPPPSHKRATEQVSVQITKALDEGLDKIRIQLRPASMGRVDVQIELRHDGRVSLAVSADNKQTLDMLKQDSRELQKALQGAGLQASAQDLSFSLHENGSRSGADTERQGPRQGRAAREPSLEDLLKAGPAHADIITKDRVDIRA